MSRERTWADRLLAAKVVFSICVLVGLVAIPVGYGVGWVSIETVNMLGRYMTFAIIAVGLDLLWGYAGILSLCQATFFCLGGYAMGIYLAHHGGPEGITDRLGWKLPACLYVVYPYQVGEVPEDAMVPWFWKPFFNLPVTVFLAVLIPGLVAALIGVFCFRSRVRGVYFAILTQAIAVAAFLFFQRNEVKFGGTNGLTRFDYVAGWHTVSEFGPKNLAPNSTFAGDASEWSMIGAQSSRFKEGVSYDGSTEGMIESGLNAPMISQTEYTGLINLASGEVAPNFCRILALNDGGDVLQTVPLHAVPRRGRDMTEYRANFTLESDATRVRYEVGFGEAQSFVLSSPRIFERYQSNRGGWQLSDPRVQVVLYVLTLLSLILVYLGCRYLVQSRFGRVLLAIRDDEPTLRFFGYQAWVYKLLAFVIAAMCAGWGGLLYAPQMKIITPYDMEPARSILVVIWVAVGGRGTLAGAIVGALSINLLYDYLTSEHDYGIFVWKAEYWQFVLGALFIGVVLLFPKGMVNVGERLRGQILGGVQKTRGKE